MLDVRVLHKTSEDSLPSVLSEGLRDGEEGSHSQDDRVRAANEFLNAACPGELKGEGVDRRACIYCYLGVGDDLIFDVESGRVLEQQRWDVGAGNAKLRLRVEPETAFVSDLDAFDALLDRMEADRLPWVLAARGVGLPYAWSRMSLDRDTHVLRYRSSRRWPGRPGTGTDIQLRVGRPVEGGPLEHFLTARWWLHHSLPGVLVAVLLSHDRWPLHTAELLHVDDQLVSAAGLPAPTEPPASVLYSPAVRGRFGLAQPVLQARQPDGGERLP